MFFSTLEFAIIVRLKGISGEYVLFNVNVNISLNFHWALMGLLEGTQAIQYLGTWALGEHSKGTRVLSAFNANRHSSTWGTKAFDHLGYSGTWALSTQTLGHKRHLGTQGTWEIESPYLADSMVYWLIF